MAKLLRGHRLGCSRARVLREVGVTSLELLLATTPASHTTALLSHCRAFASTIILSVLVIKVLNSSSSSEPNSSLLSAPAAAAGRVSSAAPEHARVRAPSTLSTLSLSMTLSSESEVATGPCRSLPAAALASCCCSSSHFLFVLALIRDCGVTCAHS